jgi:TP901 family phage tail tape measure protein
MANSAVVGLLRVLLTANTAEFETALKRSQDAAKSWETSMKRVGRQASEIGLSLTKFVTVPLTGLAVVSAKLAIDFESSFAGIRKTVDATEEQFADLAKGMRALSKEIPINVNALNKIGEAAGQLGIKTENILGFTKVMAQLGVTTNLSAEQAATSMARLANITQMPQTEFDRLGSTVVALGNNLATTESEIVDFGLRIAAAGEIAGLSEHQILGIGAAMSSVGIQADAGGTAVQ